MNDLFLVLILVALAIVILLLLRNQRNQINITGESLPAIDCSKINTQPYKGTLKIPGVGEIYCDGMMSCKDGKLTCSTQTLTCPTYYRPYPVYIVRRGGWVDHGGWGATSGA